MSRIIINKIVAKLDRLDEYLGYLFALQKVNKKSFLSDYHAYGLTERYLQLSIEAMLDIGKLIIIANNFRKPEDNQDIFTILEEQKILTRAISRRLDGVAQFRNILVHDYEKINREIIYQKLQTNMKDFKDFKKTIIRFIK